FAATSLGIHSRRAGVAAIFVIASVFVAMKARVAWYTAMQWAIGDDMRAISGPVLLIDRYAFWLAVVAGLGSWAYIRTRQIPAALHPAYRRQLRRFFLLCSLAAVALVVSVVSDAVLTSILLRGTQFSAEFLVPIFSMAIDIACT